MVCDGRRKHVLEKQHVVRTLQAGDKDRQWTNSAFLERCTERVDRIGLACRSRSTSDIRRSGRRARNGSARHAFPGVYQRIKAHHTTLIFVNTRWQAEMTFSELWRINEDNLPIALHHGSIDRGRDRSNRHLFQALFSLT